jgi:16S rRNA C967 or C1407 C5-methylase (RsmB/RsmF family)
MQPQEQDDLCAAPGSKALQILDQMNTFNNDNKSNALQHHDKTKGRLSSSPTTPNAHAS